MATRLCEVRIDKGTGKVEAVILEGEKEIARISWALGDLVNKDPELAQDMVHARFREWARLYETSDVRITLL